MMEDCVNEELDDRNKISWIRLKKGIHEEEEDKSTDTVYEYVIKIIMNENETETNWDTSDEVTE